MVKLVANRDGLILYLSPRIPSTCMRWISGNGKRMNPDFISLSRISRSAASGETAGRLVWLTPVDPTECSAPTTHPITSARGVT